MAYKTKKALTHVKAEQHIGKPHKAHPTDGRGKQDNQTVGHTKPASDSVQAHASCRFDPVWSGETPGKDFFGAPRSEFD